MMYVNNTQVGVIFYKFKLISISIKAISDVASCMPNNSNQVHM